MFLMLTLSRYLASKLILAVCIKIFTVLIFQLKKPTWKNLKKPSWINLLLLVASLSKYVWPSFPPSNKGLKWNSHCVKFRIKVNEWMKLAAVSHTYKILTYYFPHCSRLHDNQNLKETGKWFWFWLEIFRRIYIKYCPPWLITLEIKQ